MDSKQIELKFEERIDENAELAKYIYEILISCDKEFIPPLSTRNATTQTDFNSSSMVSYVPLYQYWIDILSQQNILAFVNDCLVGFMSFKYNYKIGNWFSAKIRENDINNYISTICIYKNYRRLGIARKMYDYIENNLPKEYKSNYVSTRTWSTNISHIKLLYRCKFLLLHTIPNDREYNDLKFDTLYFWKKTDKEYYD